jgi:hypothetical protein
MSTRAPVVPRRTRRLAARPARARRARALPCRPTSSLRPLPTCALVPRPVVDDSSPNNISNLPLKDLKPLRMSVRVRSKAQHFEAYEGRSRDAAKLMPPPPARRPLRKSATSSSTPSTTISTSEETEKPRAAAGSPSSRASSSPSISTRACHPSNAHARYTPHTGTFSPLGMLPHSPPHRSTGQCPFWKFPHTGQCPSVDGTFPRAHEQCTRGRPLHSKKTTLITRVVTTG